MNNTHITDHALPCAWVFFCCIRIHKTPPEAEERTEYEAGLSVFLLLFSTHQTFQFVCKVNSALGEDCFLNAVEDLSDYKENEYRGIRD